MNPEKITLMQANKQQQSFCVIKMLKGKLSAIRPSPVRHAQQRLSADKSHFGAIETVKLLQNALNISKTL